MGVLLRRADDVELYQDAYEEAQRIIRISDEVRISLERVIKTTPVDMSADASSDTEQESAGKLTTSRFARKLGLKTGEVLDRAIGLGYIQAQGEQHALTPKGQQIGVEFIAKSRFGPYFLWPEDLALT
jgi:hypothetical protein